jgi:hypothetical protein
MLVSGCSTTHATTEPGAMRKTAAGRPSTCRRPLDGAEVSPDAPLRRRPQGSKQGARQGTCDGQHPGRAVGRDAGQGRDHAAPEGGKVLQNTGTVFGYDQGSSTVKKRIITGGGIRDNRLVVVEGVAPGDILVSAGVLYLGAVAIHDHGHDWAADRRDRALPELPEARGPRHRDPDGGGVGPLPGYGAGADGESRRHPHRAESPRARRGQGHPNARGRRLSDDLRRPEGRGRQRQRHLAAASGQDGRREGRASRRGHWTFRQ